MALKFFIKDLVVLVDVPLQIRGVLSLEDWQIRLYHQNLTAWSVVSVQVAAYSMVQTNMRRSLTYTALPKEFCLSLLRSPVETQKHPCLVKQGQVGRCHFWHSQSLLDMCKDQHFFSLVTGTLHQQEDDRAICGREQ
eukprot:g41336.t1